MVFVAKSLNNIVENQLKVLSAGVLYFMLIGLIPTGILITVYILFCTKYWCIAVIYLLWIWIIDKNTSEGVGRINNWVMSWGLFKYAADYFPVRVHTEPGVSLDPNQNYLACSFPHGVMPTGVILAFQTNALSNKVFGATHSTYGITLKNLFYVPLYRDFILSIGLCSANANSIQRMLLHPGGGKIVGLIAGGSAEMFHGHGGEYKIVLKNRKGFAKLALKTGASIIPAFSFGETRIYKQKVFDKESIMRRIQEWLKLKIGFPPLFFYGRGLFRNSFGLIPLAIPINVVVGKPVEVQKNENPTQEEIDTLHEQFVKN